MDLIEQMENYIEWLLNLAKSDPTKAREIAIHNLHMTGMYDENGILLNRAMR